MFQEYTAIQPSPRNRVVSEFEAWAPFYAYFHRGRPHDAAFYTHFADRSAGPILELGCGGGRLTRPLSRAGQPVVGLDISQAMLNTFPRDNPIAACRTRADMTCLPFAQAFDLVVIPYRALMHLHSPGAIRQCFRECARVLRPGGTLVFDTWIPGEASRVEQNRESVTSYTTRSGRCVRLRCAYRVNPENREIRDCYRVDYAGDEGSDTHRTVCLMLTRWWMTFDELAAALSHAGFMTRAVFGDFQGKLFNAGNEDVVWVAKRRCSSAPQA